MKLYEYQGKQLFREYGLPVPEGSHFTTLKELSAMSNTGGYPLVVKAQVLSGKRGKAGGISVVSSLAELHEQAGRILSSSIMGERVHSILVEKCLNIEAEYYLSFLFNRGQNCLLALFSDRGGIDVEEMARKNNTGVGRLNFSRSGGFHPYMARKLLSEFFLPPAAAALLPGIFVKAYRLFCEKDCELLEINPLVLTREGAIMAADSKVVIDGNALYRHPELDEMKFNSSEYTELEKEAVKAGLKFIKLDGNIGIIGNGAGLVMTTLDVLALMGGRAANFLDIGGGSDSKMVRNSFEIILKDKNVKGLLINIFGGITRCDEVAAGICDALGAVSLTVPMVIRLAGTNYRQGSQMLENSGLHVENDMYQAAKKIIRLAS